MKYRALKLQSAPQFFRIHQISVVRQRHTALYVIYDYRLSIASVAVAGGAVSCVTDRHIAVAQALYHLRRENIVYKTGVFIRCKNSVVVNNYSARLLSAMLQGKQPVVRSACNIAFLR